MRQGRVQEVGTFTHLVNNGLDFSAYLSPEKKADEAEEENDEELATPDEEEFGLLHRRASVRSVASSKNLQFHEAGLVANNGGRTRTLSMASVTSDASQISGLRLDLNGKSGSPDRRRPSPVKEEKQVGSVGLQLFVKYFLHGGGWPSFIFVILSNLVCQGLYSASDWWITYWTNEEEGRQAAVGADIGRPDEAIEADLPSPVAVDVIIANKTRSAIYSLPNWLLWGPY